MISYIKLFKNDYFFSTFPHIRKLKPFTSRILKIIKKCFQNTQYFFICLLKYRKDYAIENQEYTVYYLDIQCKLQKVLYINGRNRNKLYFSK